MSQNFVTNHNVLVLETDHRFNFCILAQNLEYSESLNKDGANRMGQVCMVLGLRLILNVIVRSVH